jgi:hypothetical protein
MTTEQRRIKLAIGALRLTRMRALTNGNVINVMMRFSASKNYEHTRTMLTRTRLIIRKPATQFEFQEGPLSSLAGCQPRALEVAGSNPAGPTTFGDDR